MGEVASGQSAAIVTASVDGVSIGTFEERTGGDSDSTAQAYPLGGGGKRKAVPGRPEVSNVVIKRIFDTQAQAQLGFLRRRAGKGWLVVHEQPVDADENAVGEATTWAGILKRANGPDRNADGNAVGNIECELIVETVTQG